MLILSRKTEETLMIGDNIEIKIIEIVGDRVKIGIEAPKNLSVIRGELIKETAEANVMASKNSSINMNELFEKTPKA